MKISIKTTNFDLTDSTRDYIMDKMQRTARFTDSIKLPQELRIEIAKVTNHHQKGERLYKAEANLTMGRTLLRAVGEEWDVKVAVDDLKDELEREIKKFKGKQSTDFKKGARKIKDMIRGVLRFK